MNFTQEGREKFGHLFRNELSHIAYSDYFKGINIEYYNLWDIPGVAYTKEYYSGTSRLMELLKEYGRKYDSLHTAYSSVSGMYDWVIRSLIFKLQNRKANLTASFDIAITNEELSATAIEFEDIFNNSISNYEVIFFTDRIIIPSNDVVIKIGKSTIRRATEEQLNAIRFNLPDHRDNFPMPISMSIRLGKYPYKTDFVHNNTGKSAISTNITGLHYHRERSTVFENGLIDLMITFAFLHYSELLISPQFEAGFSELDSSGAEVDCLIGLADRSKWFDVIDSKYTSSMVARRRFILTEENIAKLDEECFLPYFNQIMHDQSGGEIRKKIKNGFRWLQSSMLSENPTETLLFQIISMESLFSTGNDPNISLSDQLSENAAIVLTDNFEKRMEFKSRLKLAYNIRSEIVHHGFEAEDNKKYGRLLNMPVCIALCLRNFILRYNLIKKIGTKNEHLKEYFERLKLKCPIA